MQEFTYKNFAHKVLISLNKFYPLILVLAILYFLQNFYLNITPSKCEGLGDCVKYSQMAENFGNNNQVKIETPFNLRILAPYLSSLISKDTQIAFKILNSVSILVFCFFSFFTLKKLEINNYYSAIFFSWFFLHPLGFQYYFVVPVMVDMLYYAALSIIIYLAVTKEKFLIWLAFLTFAFIKETIIFIALIYYLCLIVNELKEKNVKKISFNFFSLVFFFLIYNLIKENIVLNKFPNLQEWEVTPLTTVKWFFNELLKDYNRLIIWFCSFFCAVGFYFLSIFNFSIKNLFINLYENITLQGFLFLISCAMILFGILAGSDMTRIIFNGSQFILLFSFLVIKKNSKLNISDYLIPLFSFLLLFSYSKFFPSNLEYKYYYEKEITPYFSLGFIFLITSIGLIFLLKKYKAE